jgi:hypothetical protein
MKLSWVTELSILTDYRQNFAMFSDFTKLISSPKSLISSILRKTKNAVFSEEK